MVGSDPGPKTHTVAPTSPLLVEIGAEKGLPAPDPEGEAPREDPATTKPVPASTLRPGAPKVERASNKSDPGPKTHHARLRWNPALEDCAASPETMLFDDPFFTVCQRGRRRLVIGELPAGLRSDHPPQGRTWRACENRMSEVPAWERAQHYHSLMRTDGYRSIRALALAVGEDHARFARVLRILDLPEKVLVALRDHSDNVRVRAKFTERRLRHMMAAGRTEAEFLREIERVLQPSS